METNKLRSALRAVLKLSVLKLFFCVISLPLPVYAAETHDIYAQLSSSQTQTPVIGDALPIKMEQIESIQGMELSGAKNEIIVKKAGTYFVMAAGQVGTKMPETTGGWVDLWLTQNGKPIQNTSSRLNVNDQKSTGVLITQSVLQLKVGDKIGTALGVSDATQGLGLVSTSADKSEPLVPSMIFSMFKF